MMRGSIVVDSEEGKGSIFKFTIIFGYKSQPAYIKTDQSGQKTNEFEIPENVKDLRILLAEDNMINQRVASKVLEKFGWKVTCVVNGQEVLDILAKESFDVILMDDQMPVLDGVAATQVIRREEKQTGMHLPIIAMTANAMAGDRERYLSSGMDGYVSKPIDRSLLYNEIVTLVSQRLKG